jgi:hypothetical protein
MAENYDPIVCHDAERGKQMRIYRSGGTESPVARSDFIVLVAMKLDKCKSSLFANQLP